MSEMRELNLNELNGVAGGGLQERREREYVISNDMEKLNNKLYWRRYQREHKNEAPVIDRLTINLY